MRRMLKAGYSERYREEVLKHALTIFDEKWRANNAGTRPIFRAKDYEKEERRRAKKNKKLNWAKKGGHIAPIFVPTTPGSQLMKAMRRVAQEEGKEGIRFHIIESGGRILKREL